MPGGGSRRRPGTVTASATPFWVPVPPSVAVTVMATS